MNKDLIPIFGVYTLIIGLILGLIFFFFGLTNLFLLTFFGSITIFLLCVAIDEKNNPDIYGY